jgi:hypothetical protein
MPRTLLLTLPFAALLLAIPALALDLNADRAADMAGWGRRFDP